jgi:hypothetical protein
LGDGVSFHNDPWDAPDAWEQDAPERWERAENAERAEETERDRLTRDVPTPIKPKQYRGGVCR